MAAQTVTGTDLRRHGAPEWRPAPGKKGALSTKAGAALSGAGPALAALVACLVCYVAGWRGDDWAAQIYRAGQAARYGLVLWEPGWYSGTFPLNYSLVYPLLAGYLGLWPVAAASAMCSSFCFDRLVSVQFGRRPMASWYFAVSTFIEVAIGQLPTLTGEAFGIGCVLCLARWSRETRGPWAGARTAVRLSLAGAGPGNARHALLAAGAILGVLAALTAPIAGAFVALCLVAWGVAQAAAPKPPPRPEFPALHEAHRPPEPPRREGSSARRADLEKLPARLARPTSADMRGAFAKLSLGVVVLASAGMLPIIFPGPGDFPFNGGDLLVVLAIAALLASPLLSPPRQVRVAAVLYGFASLVLFIVPNEVGDNDARFAVYIGVPLVLCYLPRLAKRLPGRVSVRRALRGWPLVAVMAAATTAAGMVVWAWGPIAQAFVPDANGGSSLASFYVPLTHSLTRLARGRIIRVEVPPLAHHWESAYLAPTISLARGWERQLDEVDAPLFYHPGPLSPTAYRAWLLSNGVSYVALADAPLDFASIAEGALLRKREVPGLKAVWHNPDWQVWAVEGSLGLASPPARVVSLQPDEVGLLFARAGSSVIKVHWSPYWSLPSTASGSACLAPAQGGWTEVRSTRAGALALSVSVLRADHGNCP